MWCMGLNRWSHKVPVIRQLIGPAASANDEEGDTGSSASWLMHHKASHLPKEHKGKLLEVTQYVTLFLSLP